MINAKKKDDGNQVQVGTGGAININEWHHLGVVLGSQGYKMYLDGSVIDSNPDTNAWGWK